jgi:hypothetical protein
MFQNKTILILANSVRDGKHCVAGKVINQTDGQFTLTNEWIRLSNPCDEGEGAVSYLHTVCTGGRATAPMDIIKVGLQAPCNNPDHPEDVTYVPQQKWEFVATASRKDLDLIVDRPEQLWHDAAAAHSIPAGYIRSMPQPSTLYFIKAPADAVFQFWRMFDRFKNKEDVKRKLHLTYNGVRHTFSATDYAFTNRHKLFERASNKVQCIPVPNAYLCVSLTKLTPKFADKHWKICATILES